MNTNEDPLITLLRQQRNTADARIAELEAHAGELRRERDEAQKELGDAWTVLQVNGCDAHCLKTHQIHHAIETLAYERVRACREVERLQGLIRQPGRESCACEWTKRDGPIGECAPFLKPCAGHEVYGTWRAAEATKALEECRHQLGLVEDELRAARQRVPLGQRVADLFMAVAAVLQKERSK